MPEYFVFANSFAAPFFSDPSTGYTTGDTPQDGLRSFVESYNHPCGLYAAMLYVSADAYHKGHDPLGRWLSNEAALMLGKSSNPLLKPTARDGVDLSAKP